MDSRLTTVALICLLLSACGDAKTQVTSNKAARIEKARQLLAHKPEQTTYTLGTNQLLVIDFPVRVNDDFTDIKRCFVWRDTEFKTATMSCEQETTSGS